MDGQPAGGLIKTFDEAVNGRGGLGAAGDRAAPAQGCNSQIRVPYSAEPRTMRALLVMMAVLLLMAPTAVLAQEAGESDTPDQPLEGPTRVTVDVYLGEAGADLVIHPADITIGPNTQVTFHVVNVGQTDHDFTFLQLQDSGAEFAEEDLREREDGGEAVKTPLLSAGEEYDLTVTFPSDFSGSIVYICSVPGHRSGGMEGTLNVGAAAGGEEDITELGVHYLAYWVGIVSFVIIFIVLFGTFFYFRYGETKEVQDHRSGAKTVTAAAASVDTQPVEEEGGFLPDPSKVAILLSLLAIGLWALTEFTSIFGGA